MSVSAPESFRANYQAGIATFLAFAQPLFQGWQAVIDLNLQTSKAALAESESTLKGALQSSNPAEFVTQQVGASQHAVAKAVSYGQHLAEIASHTQQALVEAAQTQSGEQGQRFKAASEGFAPFVGPFTAPFAQYGQQAPLGADAFIAAMNSSIAAFNNAAETMRGATRQAIETAQSGFQNAAASAQAATQQATQAAQATAAKASAKA
ncbi:TIGR01841 family phasin [Paraburkholderia acidisoli]|uniref:TIGR01841 family phasin n=1 Tax=Paraburkholderia acidisoli TaxID=2571748 RepID=A0A7Z2JJ30_9BURK|nr:TIGR01841 family phasin [Paraburkholderia acidisoli]QGZ64944.1 TIGR01841 family phasin [Paraburkholderia acidisoli]